MQKILIITKNWLGDILFQLPAVERIRACFPDAEITCLAPPRCRPLLENHPAVDRVIDFDEKGIHRSVLRRFALAARLRRETWDKAFLLHGSRTRAFLALAAGARERIGYETDRRFLLTTAVPEPDEPLHQVDYHLRLLDLAGLEETGTDRFYRYPVNADAARSVRAAFEEEGIEKGRYAAFHLGANWAPKRWPAAHFGILADLIAGRTGMPVVITGAEGDRALGEAMTANVRRARVISRIGRTSLDELAALFREARFVVSADSGPMHIASGAGAPVIALFGPTHPGLTGPRGSGPVRVLHEIPEGCHAPWFGPGFPQGGWMERIGPRRVFEELEAAGWLDGAAASAAAEAPRWEGLNPAVLPHRKARDILIVSLSNIGDVILTTPVISLVRRLYPSACLTVVVGPKAVSLLDGAREADRLVIYDKRASLPAQIRFLRLLHGVRYDAVIDLRNTAIPFLVRARRRSPLIRRFREAGMRERHLEVLRMMRLPSRGAPVFDFAGSREESQADEILSAAGVRSRSGWILAAPVAASGDKTWPLEKFRAVLRGLLGDSQRDILLAGSAAEARIIEPLVTLDPERVFNLAGKTSLRELAALVGRSDLVLSNDSACMHLAYELNRPVTALFGPTDPKRYGRIGPRFRLIHRPEDFQDLDPAPVIAACRELLAAEARVGGKV